jgi:hypothetical protein
MCGVHYLPIDCAAIFPPPLSYLAVYGSDLWWEMCGVHYRQTVTGNVRGTLSAYGLRYHIYPAAFVPRCVRKRLVVGNVRGTL